MVFNFTGLVKCCFGNILIYFSVWGLNDLEHLFLQLFTEVEKLHDIFIASLQVIQMA